MAFLDHPLIPINQQAPVSLYAVDPETPLFPDATGYADFVVTSTEAFFIHPNLFYATAHNVTVASLSPTSNVELTISFYAGDTVVKVEKLTDTGLNYIAPGTTKIGFKTTGSNTATVRSWSR